MEILWLLRGVTIVVKVSEGIYGKVFVLRVRARPLAAQRWKNKIVLSISHSDQTRAPPNLSLTSQL